MKAGACKDSISLFITEILAVGSGLDFLIYLDELHLWDLFIPFSFYI